MRNQPSSQERNLALVASVAFLDQEPPLSRAQQRTACNVAPSNVPQERSGCPQLGSKVAPGPFRRGWGSQL